MKCCHYRVHRIATFGVAVFVCAAIVAFCNIRSAHAESAAVTGWAWAGEAGWISMSSTNCLALNAELNPDPCTLGGVSYGVSINDLGYLTGYAWSRNIGWICFGSTCSGTSPSGIASTARLNAITQGITGWAKALALGSDGWISLSCENTDSCLSDVAYRTSWDPAFGSITGDMWNGPGSVDGHAIGWITWDASYGGTRTEWDPVPLCSEVGNTCDSARDCVLPGEQCCLGGAPCGQCAGVGDWCGLHTDCNLGEICCPSGVECGRCVDDASACGFDDACVLNDSSLVGRDACCPPGAVCTRGSDLPGSDPFFESEGTVPGAVGFCAGLPTGTLVICTDDDQCDGSTCETDPMRGLCDTDAYITSIDRCTSDASCRGNTCNFEIGLCTENDLIERSVPCISDETCAMLGEGDSICRREIGICTLEDRLCVVDANCIVEGSRCSQLYLPWLQTRYGTIYSGGNVGSPQTPPPPVGEYNATYCILASGGIMNFLSAEGCDSLQQTDYDVLARPGEQAHMSSAIRIDVNGILDGRHGDIVDLPTDSANYFSTPGGFLLDGKVYIADDLDGNEFFLGGGGVTFKNGVGDQNGSGMIVIRGGDLVITGNIGYAASTPSNVRQIASPGWLVLKDDEGRGGNVIISSSVTELVGAFYVEGEFHSGTLGDKNLEKTLSVRGTIIAGQFFFERELDERKSINAAERVIADGRALANAPPGFGDIMRSLPSIRRALPQ
ncbi:MAG: hypothetical protein ABIG71_02535 [Candidatus Uhrbacteria bacterium]